MVSERRASVKADMSNTGSPSRADKAMSQQSSSDLDKSLMQVGIIQGSVRECDQSAQVMLSSHC